MKAKDVAPKVSGADVELANFILNQHSRAVPGYDTAPRAARLLLAEIEGWPRHAVSSSAYYSNQTPSRSGYWGTGKWYGKASKNSGKSTKRSAPTSQPAQNFPRANTSGSGTTGTWSNALPGPQGYPGAQQEATPATWSPADQANGYQANQVSGCPQGVGNYSTFDYDGVYRGYNPQDWGRKFLASNGGCVYIDMHHLEICLPEVASAREHLAAWFAMLQIAEEARQRANSKLSHGERLVVLANNSDGLGHSYGAHINFLITRELLDKLLFSSFAYPNYLVTYLASSIIFTGQGKVGSENGAAPVDFQISQRADFFESLMALQTTYNRPILNTRDESHCRSGGYTDSSELARLHVIFFDSNLCHVAHFLKIGVTQLVLAMLEQSDSIACPFLLNEPLRALHLWSHDPSLRAKARVNSGKSFTALEIQMKIFDQVSAFVARGGARDIVPEAQLIIELWEQILCALHDHDWVALSGQLDWVLKWMLLSRTLAQNPNLGWDSPEIKHLDHIYSSLEVNDGLFWKILRSQAIRTLVTPEEITYLRQQPPANTRAYLRAHLLRKAGAKVTAMDWSWMRIQTSGTPETTILLADPTKGTATEYGTIMNAQNSLDEVLEALKPLQIASTTSSAYYGYQYQYGRGAHSAYWNARQKGGHDGAR